MVETGYQYNTITIISSDEELSQVTTVNSSTHQQSNCRKVLPALLYAILIGFACTVAIIIILTTVSPSSETLTTATNQDFLLLPTTTTSSNPLPSPECTITECFTSGCPKTSPFLCRSNNGCSSSTWLTGTCLTQCTLAKCTSDIPSDAQSCHGIPCSKEWCHDHKGQMCGILAPYQCIEGSSRFGCTDDEFGWGIRVSESVCSGCCDSRTC
jgi:hypothetical protein